MENITQNDFKSAENKMNELLAIATQKGGFDRLTESESLELEKFTQIVNDYEEKNFVANSDNLKLESDV